MLAQGQLFKKRRSEEFLELFFSLSLTSRKEIKPVQLAMDLGCGISFLPQLLCNISNMSSCYDRVPIDFGANYVGCLRVFLLGGFS